MDVNKLQEIFAMNFVYFCCNHGIEEYDQMIELLKDESYFIGRISYAHLHNELIGCPTLADLAKMKRLGQFYQPFIWFGLALALGF